MRITHVTAIANTLTLFVHLGACWFFIYVLEMGMLGLGFANLTSSFLVYAITVIHTSLLPKIQEGVFLPNGDTFTGLREYFAIGGKMIIVVMAFVLALEMRMIFAGQLGDSEIAATAALVNFAYMLQLMSMGIQVTLVSIIGNLLGENRPDLAWRMYRANLPPWLTFITVLCAMILVFREQVAQLLSDESTAHDLEVDAMGTVAFFCLFTCFNRVIMSPLMAMKMQATVLVITIIDFYLIGIPLSCLFTFSFGMGINGLFLGGAIGTAIATLLSIRRILQIDMKEEAKLTMERLESETQTLYKAEVETKKRKLMKSDEPEKEGLLTIKELDEENQEFSFSS